ncbi:TolC family outer membrane protein [Sphingomonas sp. AOB5]|uniref:TolC family outer membrane protein n=1 Tax=Sphingomonas sp. AOB5 TaxID=3034017 RepID=UPI0023F8E7B0|nr:TolC family outer membrane protein [Sphingomonas sp. AOB5]MDF7775506.1 TolC family outer membrane protein [Sphingomonas sp. AOB5]
MRLSSLFLGVSLVAIAVPAAAQTTETAPTAATQAAPKPTMTLRDALVLAYNSNPDLAGERANLRATDEGVPIARSSGLPGVTSSAGVNESLYNTDQGLSPSRRGSVGADLSVPIYAGGSVRNSVRAAETRVEAGRSLLRAAEADIFTQVVTVYVDVIRDEAIVRLNQQNVRVLEVNLQATRDRFEVGDLTRTDVAQSEARYALAQAQLRGAEARLIGSRENFIRVVGTPPGVLAPPPALPGLPTTVEGATDIALANNPNLEAAVKSGEATRYDVSVAEAGRLPRVSVGFGGDYYNYLGSTTARSNAAGFGSDGFSTSAGVNFTMPLFQGGRPAAQVRQAKARREAALEGVTFTERGVIAQTRSSFALYQSSLRVIESSRVAVDANRLSLEGVRAENSVGTRTILDILNAEQEFLNSQVTYVTAERDAYVAGFTLLAAMGKAEAEDLGLDGGPLYDPTTNYNQVRRGWSDWSDGPAESTKGTRTNQTPVQNPEVTPGTDPLLTRPVDSTRTNP